MIEESGSRKEKKDRPIVVKKQEHHIRKKAIDPDAIKVIRRLNTHGYTAYLVGGGIRDLLLGIKPKDFDVATSARPRKIKRLFRNCFLVGRRFKLAHIVFKKNKIIEVSTFRRKSEHRSEEDLTIRRDNTYGTERDDALRRDFTVNGLFFDTKSFSIIDYVGGLADIQERVIRTIGEPDIHFQEDPVRMIRAVKFSAKLNFEMDPDVYEAIIRNKEDITKCAVRRVYEELLKLLGSGVSESCFMMMEQTGLMGVLLPWVDDFIKGESERDEGDRRGRNIFWRYLRALDDLVERGEEHSNAFLLAALFTPYIEYKLRIPGGKYKPKIANPDMGQQIDSIFKPVCKQIGISKKDADRIKQILVVQRRFTVPKSSLRFSVKAFLRKKYFHEAYNLFRIHVAATGRYMKNVEIWEERIERHAQSVSK